MEQNTDFYREDDFSYTALKMKHICISGKIGSGKTRFAKTIVQNFNTNISYPIHIIEIDAFVKHLHSDVGIQKELYKRWKKSGVTVMKNNIIRRKKDILFFSSVHQKMRAWHVLECFFHPIITNYIAATVHKNSLQKGTIVWDMALEKLFPQHIKYISVVLGSRSLYPQFFCLQKYRKLTAKEIFWYRKRQKNIM